jgi:Chalcone isomerase-like
MKSRILRAASAAFVSLCCALTVSAEPALQQFPAKVSVGADQLQLNGRGTRVRVILSVYEAALYTVRPVRSIDEVAKLEGAKRFHAMALREVDADTLGRLFMKGIKDNNPREDVARLLPSILQVSSTFTERRKLKAGDTFGFDYVPGVGTRLFIGGTAQGEWVKDPAFFVLIMRLWLGPNPADADLKQALLGLPPQRATQNEP